MKKIILLSLIMPLFLAVPAQAKLIGDFNNDGRISLPDVITFIMYLMGKAEVPEIGTEAAAQTEAYPLVTMGAEGKNAFLYDYNVKSLHPALLSIVHKVMVKGTTGLLDKDSARIEGNSHGYAEVFITAPDLSLPGEPFRYPGVVQFTALFHDYSEDGEIFLGGRLDYNSIEAQFVSDEVMAGIYPYNILGTFNLAGSYNGFLMYALNIFPQPDKLLVRGKFSILSRKSTNESLGSGGWMPPLNSEYLLGEMEVEISE